MKIKVVSGYKTQVLVILEVRSNAMHPFPYVLPSAYGNVIYAQRYFIASTFYPLSHCL